LIKVISVFKFPETFKLFFKSISLQLSSLIINLLLLFLKG
jgi:hypothetical protein